MFRPLIPALLFLLILVPDTLLAQQEGQVQQVRRTRSGQTQSVQGQPVQTADDIRPLEEGSAAALLAELGQGFLEEDAGAVRDCLADSEIPFSLEAGEGTAAPTLAPLQSREQIYYRLRDWFERVEVENIECDCSEEDLGVEDAHGVLELGLEDSRPKRIFVRLRRAEDDWRVVELRALP